MSKTSYVAAADPAIDLEISQQMATELEDYIVKDELYRAMTVRTSAGDQRLQMTGGDLLARLYRIQGERDQLSAEQQTAFDDLQKQVDDTIYSLRTRFHDRLQREMKARLDSLKWFLDDCGGDIQKCRVDFPFEMRNRQRIEEIMKRVGDEIKPELEEQLHSVDKRIRNMTRATEFIWEKKLQDVFPRSPYWYLYVCP